MQCVVCIVCVATYANHQCDVCGGELQEGGDDHEIGGKHEGKDLLHGQLLDKVNVPLGHNVSGQLRHILGQGLSKQSEANANAWK